jgi:voltage-gated potassium channel Kch
MSKQYTPVPVQAAREIAEKYEKSHVIINTWDSVHGLLHTTTYGVTEQQKHQAAIGGEKAAIALGADLGKADKFEDFRRDTEKFLAWMDEQGNWWDKRERDSIIAMVQKFREEK